MNLDFLNHHSHSFFALSIIWVAGWIVASIIYRRHHGNKFEKLDASKALFIQSGASGRSMKSFLTRMGGARNCLVVAVTDSELQVRPFFPFNLMFLPQVYDLEHRIPKHSIVETRITKRMFSKWVAIDFRSPANELRTIELGIDEPEKLIAAVKMRG